MAEVLSNGQFNRMTEANFDNETIVTSKGWFVAMP